VWLGAQSDLDERGSPEREQTEIQRRERSRITERYKGNLIDEAIVWAGDGETQIPDEEGETLSSSLYYGSNIHGSRRSQSKDKVKRNRQYLKNDGL